MEEQESTGKKLTFEQLAELREKTEAISQFLQKQLRVYLETLRPLLAPRRLLGKYTGVKEDVVGADRAFAQLQEQYKDDLVILGLSVDDTAEKLLPYAAEFKMNYPVLVGNGREDVQEAFGPLFGIPVSVIIGRDGVIAKKHSGIATKEQIEREIKTLL